MKQTLTEKQIPVCPAPNERGSATVIALLVLGLLTVFVTLALSRNTNEALAMRNDSEEGRAFYAAQASLETMTRNFNKVFETKLNPTTSDVTALQTAPVHGFGEYNFTQLIQPTTSPTPTVISGGEFAGLHAIRDTWSLRSTATAPSGAQVQLTRNFYNNRIPIFQFGIFYDGDLTLHNGPQFAFGGRVHTNKNFYLTPSGAAYFDSRVSASREIVTQLQRNGNPYTNWSDNAYIKNASGTFVRLTNDMGSVLNGPDTDNNDPDVPNGTINPLWPTHKAKFDGNLLDHVKELKLPIRLATGDSEATGNLNMIKRGLRTPIGTTAAQGGDMYSSTAAVSTATEDSKIVANERYYGKPGLRITLASGKKFLPGCAANNGGAVTDACGVRLDSVTGGDDQSVATLLANVATRGYRPLAMTGVSPSYPQATAYNAYRAYNGIEDDSGALRQTWIKVEIVTNNAATGFPVTQDITRDFLSLGITEQFPTTTGKYTVAAQADFQMPATYYQNGTVADARDSRAVIKLQRWGIPGPKIVSADTNADSSTAVTGNFKFINSGTGWNIVTSLNPQANLLELAAHGVLTTSLRIGTNTVAGLSVVPFPIEMFDPREGIYNESMDTTVAYSTNKVPLNGVMGVVDLDIANLRRFLNGDWDGRFPTLGTPFTAAMGRGLRSTDIPVSNGWLVYLSDRRGDWTFDGDYDMEDVFGPSDGVLQLNEDANSNGILDLDGVDPSSNTTRKYVWEGSKYLNDTTFLNADTYFKLLTPSTPATTDRYSTANKDVAAFADHRYYRRGFRLINAAVLPGFTDLATPSNTRGFTIACEQAVYLMGNYNATGVTSVGNPTPAGNFLPQAAAGVITNGHVPASVAADQVAFLSNAWTDGNTWRNPFDANSRLAANTTYRAAMLFGSPKMRLNDSNPNQGGGDPGLDGGVHNFINMRESWSGRTLNYCGSLINIYTVRNNTGAFKCCGKVYNPPTRNWVFDSSFLDPARLPPGTPMFQYVQITGFQRTNN